VQEMIFNGVGGDCAPCIRSALASFTYSWRTITADSHLCEPFPSSLCMLTFEARLILHCAFISDRRMAAISAGRSTWQS
jgi:hypothetical protein